ncbi:Lrp/AsnC family transcriptional regulator [Herbaspirillum sp. CAH-3]|uniref:Lrp/AsnC family transcriptional regulator n=1 Tax=Herbaspirillum sp. CAH-3 TaxID=2605746 RepID=UPI0012AC9BA2|nr:Lrp/AsnC family transcriptional regulator [Herbaspirillum sp. CAH-3]MRT28357.1 Lrp/AsnC family transcriptional regulator [Herbaspirillum sp. CAH-3]
MTRLDQLDDIDRQLLSILQLNAREPVAEIARRLGVARTTVVARIERLEQTGIIGGYTLKLGRDVVDASLQAYVGVTVQPRAGRDVIRRFSRIPEVHQLCAVSGEYDYVAWLRVNTPEQLDKILDQIGEMEGVLKTTTSVVLARKIDRGDAARTR